MKRLFYLTTQRFLCYFVLLELTSEGNRVLYDQKHQQEEAIRGIFSEACREQAAPNTRSVVCPCLTKLQHDLSSPKLTEI